MFWDGERWLPSDDGRPQPATLRRPRSRLRDWLSTAVMGLMLVALVVPVVNTSASTNSGRRLLTAWAADSQVKVYQETSSAISYRGRWQTVRYPTYLGGEARASENASDRANLKFRGAAVSWIGPIGPTRG